MNKLAMLCAAFILIVCSAYSQKNLQSGYIVLNNNDTVTGYINYRQWNQNPISIEFTTSNAGKTERYDKNNIRHFEIPGKVIYTKHLVSISLGSDRINDIAEKKTENKSDEVFLRLIHKGKNVLLFSYADEIKTRYYILTSDQSSPEELKNSIYIRGGRFTEEKEYIAQLRTLSTKYAVANVDSIIIMISKSAYIQKDIIAICRQLNGISGIDIQEKKDKASIRFLIGAGVNRNSASFSGNTRYAGNNSSSVSPLFIAGFDVIFKPELEKFYLRNSISFTGYKVKAGYTKVLFEGTDEYSYELKRGLLSINSQIAWNILNNSSFKTFISGGVNANFSGGNTNKQTYIRYGIGGDVNEAYTDNYLALSKFWLNFNAMAGMTFKNLNIAINYIPKRSINQEKGYSLRTTNLQLQFIMFLRKKE